MRTKIGVLDKILLLKLARKETPREKMERKAKEIFEREQSPEHIAKTRKRIEELAATDERGNNWMEAKAKKLQGEWAARRAERRRAEQVARKAKMTRMGLLGAGALGLGGLGAYALTRGGGDTAAPDMGDMGDMGTGDFEGGNPGAGLLAGGAGLGAIALINKRRQAAQLAAAAAGGRGGLLSRLRGAF